METRFSSIPLWLYSTKWICKAHRWQFLELRHAQPKCRAVKAESQTPGENDLDAGLLLFFVFDLHQSRIKCREIQMLEQLRILTSWLA